MAGGVEPLHRLYCDVPIPYPFYGKQKLAITFIRSPDTPFPLTLLHAVDALEEDKAVQAALDIVGPGVADYFAKLKKDEFFAYHADVSDWEHDRYLTAF